MNILVTGSTGFIANNLINSIRKGNKIYCQSRSFQNANYNDNDIKYIKHDLVNDSWEDLDLPKIDLVYFLAAQTSNHVARETPSLDLHVNLLSLITLIE